MKDEEKEEGDCGAVTLVCEVIGYRLLFKSDIGWFRV